MKPKLVNRLAGPVRLAPFGHGEAVDQMRPQHVVLPCTQPGRDLPSADQGPGTGDETLRLPGQAQRFLFAFGSIRQHFRPRRHLISAPEWRTEMTNRFAVWNQIITVAAV